MGSKGIGPVFEGSRILISFSLWQRLLVGYPIYFLLFFLSNRTLLKKLGIQCTQLKDHILQHSLSWFWLCDQDLINEM